MVYNIFKLNQPFKIETKYFGFSGLKSRIPSSILHALGQYRCKLYGTRPEEDPLHVGPDSQINDICKKQEFQELGQNILFPPNSLNTHVIASEP